MRTSALCLPLVGLLIAASAPVAEPQPSTDARLAEARAEAKSAADRLAKLDAAAAKAGSAAERLGRQRLAAAAAIEDSEARISEADAEWRQARAAQALGEARLAERRAPLAALLAGLVTMGRQPPLLVLADGGGAEEMVRVKALLDATQPVIEKRSAALRGELAAQQRFADAARAARDRLAATRTELEQRKVRFAQLESQALAKSKDLTGQALAAGDRVLASDDALGAAVGQSARRREALAMAASLAPLGIAPPRPVAGDAPLPASDFAYVIPVDAPLVEGLGSVSSAGIVSRGVRFDNGRGASVRAPASGTILFAAPYRGQDGIVIIDHGGGRTSLLLNVSADLKRGDKVTIGQPIGRALGLVGLEFRQAGVPKSPAFIAASSVALSNGDKGR